MLGLGGNRRIMATALLIQGRIRGVERPALGPSCDRKPGLPTSPMSGRMSTRSPEYMVQFAAWGVYARQMLGRPNPRVGSAQQRPRRGQGQRPGQRRRPAG